MSLLKFIFLIVNIVCPVCGADDNFNVRNARNECRSLELDRDSADTDEIILDSHVRNYIACCTLCKYQKGCTHFRWHGQGQGRSCKLFRIFGNEDQCKNSSCIPNPCVFPEVSVPVESARGYICLKARTDLGSGCSTVRDCGGGLHTECTDTRCRCQIGYLHSMSQQYCLRECAIPSDVFEGYVDKGVTAYNNGVARNVNSHECRSACTQASFQCLHVEYNTNKRICYMSATAWFDVKVLNRVLYDPGFTLNLRQCT